MTPKALVLAGLALLGCGEGCSGGRQRMPGVAPDRDADAAETSPHDAQAAADAPAAPADADALDASPKPLPVASPASRLVLPGAATLVGHGADTCTNELPAGGDRWCAFARPAPTGFTELWVIDATKVASDAAATKVASDAAATKVASGAAVACDGTDASCLRVSTRLFNSRRNGFADAGFNGATLIYGEAMYKGDSTDAFRGVLSAWRPGWAAGRALTSDSGLFCVGQARSDAALCFENPTGDGMIENLTVDLHAGSLSSATGAPLPKLDTLLLVAPTDAAGAPPRYQFDLSPAGDYAAWSTRAAADGVETLSAQKLGAATSARVAVASDVSQWAMSPDGLAWYWLAGYNHDVSGAPEGTLQAAVFPDGSGVTTLATAVGDFSAVGDDGLWFRADVASEVGALHWMADRGAPATVATVDSKVLGVLGATRDGARFLYAKTFAPVRPGPITTVTVPLDVVDLYVGSATGAAPCVPAPTPTALDATLTPSGSVVVWDRQDAVTGDEQGLATTVSSCTSTPFASRLRSLLPAHGPSGEAFVYLDDADAVADEATLRLARVVDGALVVAPPLQTRAAHVFAPLEPALPAVMYTVATGTSADGLYVYVDSAPSPSADASTEASDAGAAP
jgi:hypothetical protein